MMLTVFLGYIGLLRDDEVSVPLIVKTLLARNCNYSYLSSNPKLLCTSYCIIDSSHWLGSVSTIL